MKITEIFDRLKSLQVILGRKYELDAMINEAPQQLGTQDELLARMKKEYIEKNSEYEVVKAKVEQLHVELDETVKTREESEKNMDSITTHREYEALDKVIQEASAKEGEIRKDLAKEEKILAELNDMLKTTEAMISAQEADLNASKESLNAKLEAYKNELDELKTQEDGITPGMDQEILFKFQRIIQRNAEGIVAVRNGVCTGCHMILPGQFANEVHSGDSILFCPYCSRILFYEEAGEDEQEAFFNDAGSLSDLDDEFGDEYDEDDEDREEGLYEEVDSDDMSDDDDDLDDASDDSDN